jgi:hypothetical protein
MSLANQQLRAQLDRLDNHTRSAKLQSGSSIQDSTNQPNKPVPCRELVPLHNFLKLATWHRSPSRTVKADWYLLADCNTYGKLVRYMTAAVLGKVGQPVYGDFDIDNNTDNHWWFNSERWRLIVRINRYGIVTINANEGNESMNALQTDFGLSKGILWQDERVILFFLCPHQHFAAMRQFMESRHFFVSSTPYGQENLGHQRLFNSAFTKDGKTMNNGQGTSSPWPYDRITTISLPQASIENTTSVCIVDPKSNRLAHDKSGLFTVLAEYLATSELRKEYGF